MTIPRDTMTKENYKRWERDLPLQPEAKLAPRPEPEPPVVEDRIRFEDIPNEEIKNFNSRGRTVKNKDGMLFTGNTFYLEFTNGKTIQGWLPENEFQKLKARIPKDRIDLLQKIGL